jgi:hypothetical protein
MALKDRKGQDAAVMAELILQQCLDSQFPGFLLGGLSTLATEGEGIDIMTSLLPHAPRHHRRDAQIAQLAAMMVENPSPVIERLLASLVT